MLSEIKRIFNVIKRDGIRLSIVRTVLRILKQPDEIERVKIKILNQLALKYDYTVAYGPLKGMSFNRNVWWGTYDGITKMLGVYELHVLERLIELSKKGHSTFIDIGAADGYFAVGMVYSKAFDQTYCFEISRHGQEHIRSNAKTNSCADQVIIKGEAEYDSLKEILDKENNAVVLIDIEGAESDFLSKNVLSLLQQCHVICELHPWLHSNGYDRREKLISDTKDIFNVSVIQRDTYNPNQFSDLSDLKDEERLIAFGEERGRNMEWLVLEPKQTFFQ
jgi:hypothetical protein